jgi:hypothetical protein
VQESATPHCLGSTDLYLVARVFRRGKQQADPRLVAKRLQRLNQQGALHNHSFVLPHKYLLSVRLAEVSANRINGFARPFEL